MSLPRICAGADGLFRFGDELAELIGMAVAMEVVRKYDYEATKAERQTWADLFNSVVQPRYGEGYTIQELAEFEASIRRFIDETARQHPQMARLRALQQSRDGRAS